MFLDLLRDSDDFLEWEDFEQNLYDLCKLDDLLPANPNIKIDYLKYLKSLRPRICINNYVNLNLFKKEIKTWMEFSIQSYTDIKE